MQLNDEETLKHVVRQELTKINQSLQTPDSSNLDSIYIRVEGLYSHLMLIHANTPGSIGIVTGVSLYSSKARQCN